MGRICPSKCPIVEASTHSAGLSFFFSHSPYTNRGKEFLMTHLTVDQLTVQYGSKVVLNSVSLTLEWGDVVGLMGPNGSGKTTLIHILCSTGPRDITPTTGQVLLGCRDLLTSAPRGVALVPQRGSLHPAYRAKANILRGLSGAERRDALVRLPSLVEELGIGDLLDAFPRALSGGQYRMVEIARAFVRIPELLLLDEPTVHLDVAHQHRVREAITNLIAHFKPTVLYVTHDSAEIEGIAQRTLTITNGCIT